MTNHGTVALILGLMVASAAMAADNLPSSVLVRNGMFTDAQGMALYIADADRTPNASSCYDNCGHNWPAFNAARNDTDTGNWKIIIRDDGTRQWAYRGKPLYRFILDRQAGDAKGDGTGNVWHRARP